MSQEDFIEAVLQEGIRGSVQVEILATLSALSGATRGIEIFLQAKMHRSPLRVHLYGQVHTQIKGRLLINGNH